MMDRVNASFRLALCLTLALALSSEAQDHPSIENLDDMIVFVKCSAPAMDNASPMNPNPEIYLGGTATGSGVLVSSEGHVVTAKHIVLPKDKNRKEPELKDVTCVGAIGTASDNVGADFELTPLDLADGRIDAARLQIQSGRNDFPFVKLCEVEPWMVGKPIIAAGFPGGAGSGAVSFRAGVLATARENRQRLLETDGLTAPGMSGGPVFSRNLNGIIGIVSGVLLTSGSSPIFYGIVPAEIFPTNFGLEKSDRDCFHKARLVTDVESKIWVTNSSPIDLNVEVEEGFCFLARVAGVFDHADDAVTVLETNGRFYLTGSQGGNGKHEGAARCYHYD